MTNAEEPRLAQEKYVEPPVPTEARSHPAADPDDRTPRQWDAYVRLNASYFLRRSRG